MSVFRFGAAQSPPRRPIVQGSEQSPFCTSPSQLQEVTLDPNMNTTIPFPGRSPGKTPPLRGHTLKEYEEQLAQLKKENFNLKLRIYFLEERMGRMNADDKEDIIKKNIELRVEAESLRKDVSDKQELVCHASKALELLEEQHKNKLKEIQCEREVEKGIFESRIQELEKEIKEYEEKYQLCASHHTQEEVDQLQHTIEELEIQVNHLGCSVHNETERANQLDVDLQEAQQEAERLSLRCRKLDGDLEQCNDQLENLRQELEQKAQDLVKCNQTIKSLEDALSAKEPEIQIKVQELIERDRIIEEKQNEIEKQTKVLVEIQITLDEKQRQIEALHSSLSVKDETIATLENRLEKAKATAQNLETKLEFSLQEVNQLKEEVETLKAHQRRYKIKREHQETYRLQPLLQKTNNSFDENVTPSQVPSTEDDSRRKLESELIDKEKRLQILEEKEKNSSRVLLKIRQELNQKDQEVQALKSHMKTQGPKLNELEKRLKEKDDKMSELQTRQKKSLQTLQHFSKMLKEANHNLEQAKLEIKKKDQEIKTLTSQCNEVRETLRKTSVERRQVRTRGHAAGMGGMSPPYSDVIDIAGEENERLWAEVEEKNKKLLRLTEERDRLSIEMERQVQSLLKRLAEKEGCLEECESRLKAVEKDIQYRDNLVTDLEHELNELRTSLKEVHRKRDAADYKEEGQQTDDSLISKMEMELTRELTDKSFEIERLNSELRKRTTNLQELVNKELWDKNREIEKLQDRLNLLCERKEVEIVALRQQIEARDFQLKVVQDRVAQMASQSNFPSPMVIKEVQPITLNNHLHIQQPDVSTPSSVSSSVSVPSLEDEVTSLRKQLLSSMTEKKYLYQRLEDLKEQLHNVVPQEYCDNSNSPKTCPQCTKAKQEAKRAENMHKETAEVCSMLTQRLEELARFLSSLLKCPGFIGALGQRRQKILKQVVENSMELSRRLTVSFSEIQVPNITNVQMSSLSLTGLLESASEINLSLLNLQDEEEDETETEISCYETELQGSQISDNDLCTNNKFVRKSKEGLPSEQTQLVEELRSQVELLKAEIKRRDVEISQAYSVKAQDDGCREQSDKIDNSGISFILKAKGDHSENRAESESSFSSLTFYNSLHCSNANEKWPKPLPLSLRKEDTNVHTNEEKECKCNLEGRFKSSPCKHSGPRHSQSANSTPVKADSVRSSGTQRIRRSSSANAVSGSLLHTSKLHREYGVASLSESEAWSEPDRNVSMARIGLREDNLKTNITLMTGTLNTTCCSIGGSGRARRSKEIDDSSESSEETARENSRTPGKRIRGDAGDTRKLQSKIRVLEQMNDALRAELDILHQLTPTRGGLEANNDQPLTRDISVNTTQAKLDKSTSVELQGDDSSVTIPLKLLEQIRYQREKLESSLFHNDFIRKQLEHIFVTLASSQGGDIGNIWQKLKETSEELCVARTHVQELQTKVLELETQLKDSKIKVQHLEETIEQLQKTRETVSVLKERIGSLETKLKEKDNEILEQHCLLLETRNKGEEQLIEARKAIEEANRSKEQLQRQLQEVDVLLTDSERRVHEAEEQLKECEAKLQEAERQKECMRNETSEKIKKIELEIYEAEKRRNEAEIQVIEAKKQLQLEESKRYEAEWKMQELEEKLRLRESEYEKYFHEVLDRKIKEIELRANLQIRETEKRLEQKELFHKAEAEKKIREAERLGNEFEAGLRRQIEEAERQGKAVKAEGDKKVKELEEKYKLRETELKKRIHESEHNLWEKEAELRRQLDEAAMKHSQTALERTRLANEKLHLEQELRRFEAREAELLREKKEVENHLMLSKDKLDLKVLEMEEKKNDLERRVRELEYVNAELEQRLAKIHSIEYHSQHNTSHLSGPYSSTFPYRKADTISSSSGLDTYSGDGGSLPSSIWSLPPGTGEDGKRKDDNLKGGSSSFGLSALSSLVLQQGFGFGRQRSELSDYMSEGHPVEEYETVFPQNSGSNWFSAGGHNLSHTGNIPPDSIVPRNINSSPDLGIESDQGRFSSLETSAMPPPGVHLEAPEPERNPTDMGSDVDVDPSISETRLLSGGELEDENARLLKENANLKRDLFRTRRSLQATLSQLTSSNQLKKQMEKAICKQLHKTHHILQQARRDNLEGDDVKYLTTTVESPE
ncbi:centrosomin isoform X2 [Anabrus simplex]|uniref:centrosomin isoform X2 n=1 Tax=Anabrus simplex TaxID=316456 RepID=UPI0035A30185